MKIDHAIEIDAAVQTVRELTVDIESWPAINPNITSLTRLDEGELRAGSRARLKQPGQHAKVWTVEHCRAPNLFVWSARMLWLTMTATHELTATPEGTRNRLEVAFSGRSSRFFGVLLGCLIQKVLVAENEGFKRAAESRSRVRSGRSGGRV